VPFLLGFVSTVKFAGEKSLIDGPRLREKAEFAEASVGIGRSAKVGWVRGKMAKMAKMAKIRLGL
jgi:hypothetical protein